MRRQRSEGLFGTTSHEPSESVGGVVRDRKEEGVEESPINV